MPLLPLSASLAALLDKVANFPTVNVGQPAGSAANGKANPFPLGSCLNEINAAVLSTAPSAYKSASQSQQANVVLTNDSELVVTLPAVGAFRVRGRMFVTIAGASGIKVALNGTLISASMKAYIAIYEDGNNTTNVVGNGRVTAFGQTVSHGGNGTGDHWVEIDGTIEVTTPGTLVVQWAQQNSNNGALTVQRGSWIETLLLQ